MQNISEQTDEVIQEMGAKSQKVMDDWLSRDLPENLVQYLEQTRSKAGRKTGQAGQ
jgi:hypothetical protein